MTWRPLLDDEAARARAIAIRDEIVDAVRAFEPTNLDEAVDRALLFAYLGIDDDGDALAGAVTRLASGPAGVTLYGGAARVGWAVAHLADGEQADEVCAAIDRHVARAIDDDRGHYDLISGLVGFGVYALERKHDELARAVLAQLARRSSPADVGVTWFTPASLLPEHQVADTPEGHHDLGLAHGVPGVVALLARYVDAGIADAKPLLDGAVAYLCSIPSPYPAWLPSRHPPTMRVAWCYNDLGVAAALLAAGRRDEGLAVARACAACPLDDAGVRDAVLCHGAIGNAHLFNRMWQATGDEPLRAAARAWLERGLAMRRAEPIAGFPSWRADDGWVPDATILTGAPGVALVLHAALTDEPPGWDRLLLLDMAS